MTHSRRILLSRASAFPLQDHLEAAAQGLSTLKMIASIAGAFVSTTF